MSLPVRASNSDLVGFTATILNAAIPLYILNAPSTDSLPTLTAMKLLFKFFILNY